jgi:sn-glycerol 3-phosphate transport system ATP-binding protein
MSSIGIAVRLDRLVKTFPGGHVALDDVTLDVQPGEWLVVVGPSGGGKSTALRLIAGLETPSAGDIFIDGRIVTQTAPWRRGVAMAFQQPALVPSQTVLGNLMLGSCRRAAEPARRLAGLLDIADILDRYPYQLSGGQQQRVALGRALARQAPVCLLDEPLGHLDAPLRRQLERDLTLLHREFPATIISVTHDPAEAWVLGQRVAVLHQGRLQQAAQPGELYRRPSNRFVAEFCGGGPMNFFAGRAQRQENSIQWMSGDWRCAVPWSDLPDADAILGLRAEDVRITAGPAQAGDIRPLVVAEIGRRADGRWVRGIVSDTVSGKEIAGWADEAVGIEVGQMVFAQMNWNQAFLFDGATGRTLRGPLG